MPRNSTIIFREKLGRRMRGRRKRKRRRKIEDRRGGREVGREDGREGGQRRMEGGYLEGVLVPDIVAPTQALLP